MEWILGALCIVIIILAIIMAIVLYNFMLLLSELNKRLIYVVSDVLQSIDLSTPHIDTLNPDNNVIIPEDILNQSELENNYFNPHEYEEQKEANL